MARSRRVFLGKVTSTRSKCRDNVLAVLLGEEEVTEAEATEGESASHRAANMTHLQAKPLYV